MDMTCNMAGDLLPLYLENSCSEDSRRALEEHLKTCPACRKELERMQSPLAPPSPEFGEAPDLAAYGRKVQRHRIRMAAAGILGALLASVLLALVCLAVSDMRRQAHPHVFDVEAGVWNLTAGELRVPAEEAGQYVLYTNYQQIRVTAEGEGPFQGTVELWDAEDGGAPIQTAQVDGDPGDCVFQNLSAARRYRITCEGLEGTEITVSEGREVSFWGSLRAVMEALLFR